MSSAKGLASAVRSALRGLTIHGQYLRSQAWKSGLWLSVEPETKEIEMSSEPGAQADEFEALYVQSAQGVTSRDGAFTLHGLAPSTLMFSDRPERIVGHLTAAQFVEGWGHGENSFQDDPPNAVLSFLEEGDEIPEDVVVTLTNPRMEGADLTYNATLLEGELPSATGPCSLFIDPVGRPLSPVSVMGVRRRQRRRGRRF
jgi:hypothetical protein